MTESEANIVGTIAATLTTIAFIPQVVQVVRTKSTQDISLTMYITFIIGVACWLIYGIYLGSLPMMIANSLTICLSAIVLFYKIRYR